MKVGNRVTTQKLAESRTSPTPTVTKDAVTLHTAKCHTPMHAHVGFVDREKGQQVPLEQLAMVTMGVSLLGL